MVILGFCLFCPSLPSQVQAFYLGEDRPFFRLPGRRGKGGEGGGGGEEDMKGERKGKQKRE